MSHASVSGHSRPGFHAAMVTVGGFVVLGVLVGWLWAVLAEPAAYTVTRDGATMGETQASRQFGVTVTFAWLGVLAATAWGALCAWKYASAGWVQVAVTLLGAAAASVVGWRLGVHLGPPDPGPIVRDASVGAEVPMRLRIDSYGVLLVWPIGALAGLLAAVRFLVPPDSVDPGPHGT